MEPASSSEDDSEVDEKSSKLDFSNFDDLPSDDSCMVEDSSSDSESESDDRENEDGPSSPTRDHIDEKPLGERLDMKRKLGVTRDPSVAAKKDRALKIAQQRLSDMKHKKRSKSESDDEEHQQLFLKSKSKRSKNAPTSASSKRDAYFSRGAPDLNSSGIGVEIGANKYKPRDPRHQTMSGYLDQTVFEKRYEFLEKMQDDEIEKLKQRCKAWKTTGKKGQKLRKKLGLSFGEMTAKEDEELLSNLIQERKSRHDAKIRTSARRAVKKRLKEEVASGKRGAYYLKKREIKKLELEAKFEELKRVGGDKKVNEAIAKRRKKRMARDSSLMPEEE